MNELGNEDKPRSAMCDNLVEPLYSLWSSDSVDKNRDNIGIPAVVGIAVVTREERVEMMMKEEIDNLGIDPGADQPLLLSFAYLLVNQIELLVYT